MILLYVQNEYLASAPLSNLPEFSFCHSNENFTRKYVVRYGLGGLLTNYNNYFVLAI